MSAKIADILVDPQKLARFAGLRYVKDEDAGFSREQNSHGFKYFNARGKPLRNLTQLRRIEQLAIPPAWTDVWICRFNRGHLQATGFDDRRRKQYLYHPDWRSIANSAKFLRLADFGRLLPTLRRIVARALIGKELTRERVVAGIIAVLDATSIRVGNEEYVRANNSFGLTTLRNRHVTIKHGLVEFRFRAKGGVQRKVVIKEKRLIRLMRQLKRLQGSHVFQYRDVGGDIHQVDSSQVNEYLREVTGETVTAKDFRTWKASALAANLLYEERGPTTQRERKNVIKRVVADVAELLGNTPNVCRKSYIHPGLLTSYEEGKFQDYFRGFSCVRKNHARRQEQIFARFLRSWNPRSSTEHL